MKRTAFLAAAITVALSAVTVGGMATAADQDEAAALGSNLQSAAPIPQRVVSTRLLMLQVPDQRVAGVVGHVDPSCAGDGRDGNRVQVLYVRSRATSSQFTSKKAEILDELRTVDDVFAASAAKTGGGLRVRWVYGPGCVPAIEEVAVSPAAITGDSNVMKTELQALGYNRLDRKYLVFTESRRYCGISDKNVPGSISRIDSMCWPLEGTSIAAHEFGHSLGAVAGDAPHHSGWGHCNQTGDLMCNGQQTPGEKLLHSCPTWQSNWFDCGSDDYFSMNPTPGSYLDSDRNIARSPFLDTVPVLPDAPQVRVTAQLAPYSARRRAGQGQVVIVRASSTGTVSGWKFPAVSGLCRLETSQDGPRLKPQAGTATYSCLQDPGSQAKFTVQALGSDQRVGYGSAGLVLRTAPVLLRISGKPVAGRAFSARAVGDGGDHDLSYWWVGGKGCRKDQGRTPGPEATFVCPARMSGRSITVGVSVYRRNGDQFKVSRRVVLRRH